MREWEQTRLDTLTSDIFGFNALQIGLPQIDALRANRMPNRWLSDMRLPAEKETDEPVAACPKPTRALSLIHDYCDLPFASQSIDLVVLPHVLEFSKEPHQILREVERVLIPEGQVIICGFNPVSMWGVRQKIGACDGRPFFACRRRIHQCETHERLAQVTEYGNQSRTLWLLCATVHLAKNLQSI